jgi:hypothetical protein
LNTPNKFPNDVAHAKSSNEVLNSAPNFAFSNKVLNTPNKFPNDVAHQVLNHSNEVVNDSSNLAFPNEAFNIPNEVPNNASNLYISNEVPNNTHTPTFGRSLTASSVSAPE